MPFILILLNGEIKSPCFTPSKLNKINDNLDLMNVCIRWFFVSSYPPQFYLIKLPSSKFLLFLLQIPSQALCHWWITNWKRLKMLLINFHENQKQPNLMKVLVAVQLTIKEADDSFQSLNTKSSWKWYWLIQARFLSLIHKNSRTCKAFFPNQVVFV